MDDLIKYLDNFRQIRVTRKENPILENNSRISTDSNKENIPIFLEKPQRKLNNAYQEFLKSKKNQENLMRETRKDEKGPPIKVNPKS